MTLVVLPVLYAYLNTDDKKERKTSSKGTIAGLSVIALLFSMGTTAQQRPKSLQELIPIAIENNEGLKASELNVAKSDALINSVFHFDKTHVYYQFDENNLAFNNEPLRVFGVQQDFRFPTLYFSEKKVNKARYNITSSTYDIQKKGLVRKLTTLYYEYQIAKEKKRVYERLDSLYANFSKVAARRFELGETNYLEKLTAASKQKQIHLKYTQTQKDVGIAYINLLKTIQTEDSIQVADAITLKIPLNSIDIGISPEIDFYQGKVSLLKAEKRFERQRLLPDIGLEYFQGTNSQLNESLSGYQLGIKIPLLFGGQSSRIKAARIAEDAAIAESREYEIQLNSKWEALKMELIQLQKTLDYYEDEGTALSDEILKTANGSFRNGEIDFYQYIQSLESSYEIKLDYLEKLRQYNQTVIYINYLTL